jgi:hypothetical protein
VAITPHHHRPGGDPLKPVTVFDSISVNQPSQYPPYHPISKTVLDGTGAPGSLPPSANVDEGYTLQPGEYPDEHGLTGAKLGGTGAPGTQGIPAVAHKEGPGSGGDRVQFTPFNGGYKGEYDPGGMSRGDVTASTQQSVTDTHDWTQANAYSYNGPIQMPGCDGNTPAVGGDRFQAPAGKIRRGGFTKGDRS